MPHRNRRLLIAALCLASLFTIGFSVRGAEHARRLRARSAEPIEPWMNVRYIAHAYHVPPAVIHQALGLPPDRPDRRPLWQIAKSQGRASDMLVADIEAAISRARSAPLPPIETPPAPPPPPPIEDPPPPLPPPPITTPPAPPEDRQSDS